MNIICMLLAVIAARSVHGSTGRHADPPIRVDCPITEVRVFPEGALTIHTATIRLEEGRSRIELVLADDGTDVDEDLGTNAFHFKSRGARLVQSTVHRSGPLPSPDWLDEQCLRHAFQELHVCRRQVGRSWHISGSPDLHFDRSTDWSRRLAIGGNFEVEPCKN